MTAALLVKKYIEIRDFLAAKAEERDAADKPYREAMTAIEGALAIEMDRLQCDSIKTEFGTPYRSTIVTPKVTDRDKFMQAVVDDVVDFGAEAESLKFFTAAISKEAVKAYMEDHADALPPGVEVTSFKKLNIRRS